MSAFALTPSDVARLLADPSEHARANTVAKISNDLEKHSLTPDERKLAEEIIRILSKDAAQMVRQAIADSMKKSRQLPADLAELLALDAEAIALPILQNSPMLSDAFLIKVIRERGAAEQVAIAGRTNLSGSVVTTLVERGEEVAVAKLMSNHTANLAEHNIAYALERFPQSEMISAGLVARPMVPPYILEYLVAEASEALREKIKARPDYKQVNEVITEARERATLRIIGRGRPDAELEEVARQLVESQRLTASLVLRTLCLGDMRFFEICMATSAKIPVKNARALIHDQGSAGLQALYAHTGLVQNFLPAIRHALDIASETDFDGGQDDMIRYRKRLIERILTDPRDMMPEDVAYLMDKLSDLEV